MGLTLKTVLQNRGMGSRVDLHVPFNHKDDAKAKGAKWDRENHIWYIPGDMPFEKARDIMEYFDISGYFDNPHGQLVLEPKYKDILDLNTTEESELQMTLRKAATILNGAPDKIICFDTETTGFHKFDEILQLSAYGTEGALYNQYFKPERRRTWDRAAEVNHITPDVVKDSPSFASERQKIQMMFSGAEIIVGHNVAFDVSKMKEHGVDLSHAIILDTMHLFRMDRPDKKHKLVEAVEYYCPDLLETFETQAHDSNMDTWATMEVFKRQMASIIKELGLEEIASEEMEIEFE